MFISFSHSFFISIKSVVMFPLLVTWIFSLFFLVSPATGLSRDTWSNRKIWPCSTKWSRAKTNRVSPRERTGHNKHLLPTHKRRLYTWTSSEPVKLLSHVQLFAIPWTIAYQVPYMDITRWSILKSDWLYGVLYSQQKQDLELTVAEIMSSSLQNSGLNWRK